ncbi:MAG: DUF2203 domain-containing protein [Planctomycetes bacterium]|nr:DUF2203 domain-containing protein [Planctomycetota bacterium]
MSAAPAETKLFTLHEARKMLPLVRSIVRDVLENYAAWFERQQAYLQLKGHKDRPTPEELARGRALDAEMSEIKHRLDSAATELASLGVELKDFETGLVDFRSLREGEEVYLCWKYGEDSLSFWHPLDSGFKGRRPLGSEA